MVRVACKAATVVVLLCVLAWAGATGYLWFNEPRMVFRSEFSRRAPRVLDPAFTALELRTADGVRLDAAMLAADDRDPARYWVLYFQGNAGSLRRPRVQQQLQTVHDLGYDVLSFDYRGYGRSEGTPTERGLYEDGVAAYTHLTRAGIAPDRIILAGQSLGSAVAVELATRVPAAGVALFSPIDSVPLTASRIYPWLPINLLAANRFDSRAKIELITRPVLVFHSASDRLIPLDVARALYDRIRAPKRMIETGGGHNRAGFVDPDALRAAFWTFWPAQNAEGVEDAVALN